MTAAAAITGAASMGTSLINGLFSRKSNKETNKTNLKIAQMNNEFNEREALKQREWSTAERIASQEYNTEMWNKENEYNTASAQRQRLEEAGLNPYLMMDGGSAGTASSAPTSSAGSGGQASAAAAPSMIPEYTPFDFTSVIGAVSAYYDAKKKASEATGQDIQNDLWNTFGRDYMLSQVANNVNGNFAQLDDAWRNNYKQNANLMSLNSIKQFNDAAQSAGILNEKSRAETALLYADKTTQENINKWFDVNQQVQISEASARIYSLYSSGAVNEQTCKNLIATRLKIAAETAGIKIQNKVAEQTADGLIRSMNMESRYNGNYYEALSRFAKQNASNTAAESNLSREMKERENKRQRYKYRYTEGPEWIRKMYGSFDYVRDFLPFLPTKN